MTPNQRRVTVAARKAWQAGEQSRRCRGMPGPDWNLTDDQRAVDAFIESFNASGHLLRNGRQEPRIKAGDAKANAHYRRVMEQQQQTGE